MENFGRGICDQSCAARCHFNIDIFLLHLHFNMHLHQWLGCLRIVMQECYRSRNSGACRDQVAMSNLERICKRCMSSVTHDIAKRRFFSAKDEPPPYRVENWSDSRTLALRFRGSRVKLTTCQLCS